MSERAKVLLHWDAEGQFHWIAAAGVEVICVDERTPLDRVYTVLGEGGPEAIDAVARGDFRDPIDAVNSIFGSEGQ